MKRIGFVLIAIIALFALSCSTQSNFGKRKYRKGIFREHAKKTIVKKGKAEAEQFAYNPNTKFKENQEDFYLKANDSTAAEKPQITLKSHKESTLKNPNEIVKSIEQEEPLESKKDTDYTRDDEQINRDAQQARDLGISGLVFSISSLGMVLASLLSGLGVIGVIGIIFAIVALIVSILGLLKSIHKKLRDLDRGQIGKNAFALNLTGLIISSIVLLFLLIAMIVFIIAILSL